MSEQKERRAGVGVDATGGSVVDPTANVIALNEAAVRRQDDLRGAFDKYVESQLAHVEEVSRMRADHVAIMSQRETSRIDAMRDAQLQHVEQMARLRAEHTQDLLKAEASRINAIREVDVGSVATANERAQQQAVVLANQVATSAETLRALVASTNAAVANSMTNMSTQFSDRISLLERSQYESKGKAGMSDPMMAQMVDELKNLRNDMTLSSGKGQGVEAVWGWIVAAAGSGGILAWIVSHYSK